MRVVVQRVSEGRVVVAGETIGAIGPGLVVFAGLEAGDTEAELRWMRDKVSGLRIFEDDEGKMNLDAAASGGALLVVPNFTVAGDCRRGRRPSFDGAKPPDEASPMFDAFVGMLRETGLKVEAGRFGAEMDVSLTSDGPITLVIERQH